MFVWGGGSTKNNERMVGHTLLSVPAGRVPDGPETPGLLTCEDMGPGGHLGPPGGGGHLTTTGCRCRTWGRSPKKGIPRVVWVVFPVYSPMEVKSTMFQMVDSGFVV